MAVKALNPRLTIFQIVALQSFHYVMLGLIFEVNHVFLGSSLSLSCIFSPDAVKLNSVDGLADAFALILGQTINAVLLALIVEKSKRCLDFTITLNFLHLVNVCLYSGFPATWDWWIVNIFGMIVMVCLGEWLCSRRELSDIPSLL
ncbi:hypothetical protein ScalyP_jg6450 [Parmales sp. scaly parma]|nr:hypothetical protein ScalyP_jg6450 [Parmales sp. scaly parma]